MAAAEAKPAAGKLLPSQKQEFRSKEYWESFFKQRKSAFEWYGEWKDLRGMVQPVASKVTAGPGAAKVLMIGCGNSELSADMYDDGLEDITNIDFSEEVIAAMAKRNSARPGMTWHVADMLDSGLPDAAFDVVVDKGALDALAADDSKAVMADVSRLFREVNRMLRPGGVYACVSLLQDHVLGALLAGMPGAQGLLVPFQPADSVSALCPFLALFRKGSGTDLVQAATLPAPVASGACPPELQAWLQGDLAGQGLPSLTATVHDVQWKFKSLGDLQRVSPGRVVVFDVPAQGSGVVTPGASAAATADEPRFRVAVVDTAVKGKSCGVLLVPQGREVEWVFASDNGRLQLAEGQGYSRLVFVTLGRGHTFGEVAEVQAELSPTMGQLALEGASGPMPFLAVASDLGRREEVERISLEDGQVAIIEDVWEDASAPAPSARRMVFSSNQAAVQTEGRLAAAPADTPVGPGELPVDHSFLAFEFHAAMAGALGLVTRPLLTASTALAKAEGGAGAGPQAFKVLLVGLGGGGLPMFLAKHYPFMAVESVEISPAVVSMAEKHFGFATGPTTTLTQADGVAVLKDPTGEKVHAVILDVDSKDLASGVSFPPPAFLEQDVLQGAARRLLPGGVMLVNVASRTTQGFNAIQAALETTFSRVYQCIDDESSVNQLVIASEPKPAESETASGQAPPAAAGFTPANAKAAGKLMAKLATPPLPADVDVQEWAETFRPAGDVEAQLRQAMAVAAAMPVQGGKADSKKKRRGKRGGKKKR